MKNTSFKIFSLLAVVFSFTSCLKEGPMNIDPSKSNTVIEFANTGDNVASGTSQYPRFHIDLGSIATGASASFNLNINYSGADVAPEDLTVNLVVDEAALETFNTENGTSYSMPPADVYEFPSSVIIKKGTRLSQSQISITVSNSFDFNESYALPVKIQSVSSGIVSANFGTAVYSFVARNKYDGVYEAEGEFQDVLVGPSFTDAYPKEINLVTYGAKAVGYFDPNLNGGIYGYMFLNAGSGSYYGNFAPIFHFDDAGNVVNVTNYYPNNSQLRDAKLDPTGINQITFDGDTPVKVEVSYFLTQGGATKAIIKETLTYVGPR